LTFAGVLIFSLTLPMTRLALHGFSAITVGLGRAILAGIAAGGWLLATQQKVPSRPSLVRIAVVAAGIVFAFPMLTALALQAARSSDLTVVIATLPITTAIFGVLKSRERPSVLFWLAGACGVFAVVWYACSQGAQLSPRTLLLTGTAVVACAYGYAEGGALAKTIGGPQVIAWALVLSLPLLVPLVALSSAPLAYAPTPTAWLGLAWVSFGSMFLGFAFWYRGLALAGVVRASQVQLMQPALTLVWSHLLLGEALTRSGMITTGFVALCMLICVSTRFTSRDRKA
jgi:drug/metabolite transporter (DMT)-like permease